jgi:hypothetical protein
MRAPRRSTVRLKKSPSRSITAPALIPILAGHLHGVLRLLEEVQPTQDRVARFGEVEHDAVAEPLHGPAAALLHLVGEGLRAAPRLFLTRP